MRHIAYATCSDFPRTRSTLRPDDDAAKKSSISSMASEERNRTFLSSSSRLNAGRRNCSRSLFFLFIGAATKRLPQLTREHFAFDLCGNFADQFDRVSFDDENVSPGDIPSYLARLRGPASDPQTANGAVPKTLRSGSRRAGGMNFEICLRDTPFLMVSW
jgi:hypothetical protein